MAKNNTAIFQPGLEKISIWHIFFNESISNIIVLGKFFCTFIDKTRKQMLEIYWKCNIIDKTRKLICALKMKFVADIFIFKNQKTNVSCLIDKTMHILFCFAMLLLVLKNQSATPSISNINLIGPFLLASPSLYNGF